MRRDRPPPAGLGALVITVSPPPAAAPATTVYLRLSVKPGTGVFRKVMAALSLNAVRTVALSIREIRERLPRSGSIHFCFLSLRYHRPIR